MCLLVQPADGGGKGSFPCASLCRGHNLLQVCRQDLFQINTLLILRKDIQGKGSEQSLCAVHGRRPQSSIGTQPHSALPLHFTLCTEATVMEPLQTPRADPTK